MDMVCQNTKENEIGRGARVVKVAAKSQTEESLNGGTK